MPPTPDWLALGERQEPDPFESGVLGGVMQVLSGASADQRPPLEAWLNAHQGQLTQQGLTPARTGNPEFDSLLLKEWQDVVQEEVSPYLWDELGQMDSDEQLEMFKSSLSDAAKASFKYAIMDYYDKYGKLPPSAQQKAELMEKGQDVRDYVGPSPVTVPKGALQDYLPAPPR